MTTPVFPSLAGLGLDTPRSVEWSSSIQTARSGKETIVGNWTYPVYHWELAYDFLRLSPDMLEMQRLTAFFNAAAGQVGRFLYRDPDDNQVTNQLIGMGDGHTCTFQLVRAFGGYVEPIWAPNVVSSITVGGAASSPWSVATFDSTTPGLVTFVSPPAVGAPIAASFSFYFPSRFEDDRLTLKRFMTTFYTAEKIAIKSVK